MKELINTGTIVLNARPEQEEKTVVVLGIARSGTSMIAQLLVELGVYIGEGKPPVNEDTEISNLLEKNRDLEKFDELVTERNAKYKVWGWKRPEAFRYIRQFENRIRNPHFIFLFRDPLAIGLREQTSMQANLFQTMMHAQKRYTNIIRYLQGTEHPCLLVSYEKALLKSEALVDTLCEFLGIDVDDELKDKALSSVETDSAEYLRQTSRKKKPIGNVRSIKGGIIKGWAHNGRNKQKQKVDVHIDGQIVQNFVADEHRLALEKKKIGDGHHGFTVDLSKHLVENPRTVEVDLRFHGTELSLSNSPFELRKPLFFMHIPKVGGTSLRSMLYPLYKTENLYPSGRIMRGNTGYPTPNKLARVGQKGMRDVDLLYGHYPFICHESLGKHFFVACMFREPISRMISQMFHIMRRHPELSMREIWESRRERVVSTQVKYFADQHFTRNLIAYSDDPLTDEQFEQATKNLDDLSFVGLNEEYALSVELMRKTFNLPIGEVAKKNVGDNKDMSLFDDELMAEMREAAKPEIEFYEKAVQIFERNLAEHGLKREAEIS
jgi:hypothetical protein